jgi:hypothetical protein
VKNKINSKLTKIAKLVTAKATTKKKSKKSAICHDREGQGVG